MTATAPQSIRGPKTTSQFFLELVAFQRKQHQTNNTRYHSNHNQQTQPSPQRHFTAVLLSLFAREKFAVVSVGFHISTSKPIATHMCSYPALTHCWPLAAPKRSAAENPSSPPTRQPGNSSTAACRTRNRSPTMGEDRAQHTSPDPS